MSRGLAQTATALALALALPAAVAAAGNEATSFEAVARDAQPAPDAEALAASFSVDCTRMRREIDRARCRGMQSFAGDQLGQRLYTQTVDSPNVVAVGGYEPTLKGFRMRVVGCLTCEEPVNAPEAGKRFLTLKTPSAGAETMGVGVTVARPVIPFESMAEAKAWEAEVKPNLRAQYVFKAAATPWSFRQNKGLAFEAVALRVFDRCTGHVVYSEPPSEGKVAVSPGTTGCAVPSEAKAVASAAAGRDPGKEGLAELPEKLNALEISSALRVLNPEVGSCDAQFKTAGQVDLEFEVPGAGGSAQAVRAMGQLGGTPVAQCLLQAARKVSFPKFQQAKQTFKFSVRLDGN